MISDHYIWLLWSSAFLIPWVLVYIIFTEQRKAMWWSSVFTTPFGLSEPLFVPEYWMPPSLFDLAEKTGFDIESLIFCFAIGGIGAVFYNLVTNKKNEAVTSCEKSSSLHRHHYKALASPFIFFTIFVFFQWNPIYPSILAMFLGAAATILCRPDLKRKIWVGGFLFLTYYVIFLTGLELTSPGYIDRVWNMAALSGMTIGFMPVEELLFAIGFGMYWSGVYEHVRWKKLMSSNDHA